MLLPVLIRWLLRTLWQQPSKKIGEYDIIIGGRQAIDGDTAQVGPQVAEKLGLTQITYAEEILKVGDGSITVKRHIDGGVETVEGPLPIVITVNGSAAPAARAMQSWFRSTNTPKPLPRSNRATWTIPTFTTPATT